MLKSVGNFLHKNRNKIIIASVVAVAVAVYVQYNSSSEPELVIDENDSVDLDGSGDENGNSKRIVHTSTQKNALSPGNRSRLLLRIRRQFDMASRHFMPTLRIKIIEVVDINGTVRQIKELRAKSNESSRQLEAQLWEEIKISSFSMLFVTAYMLSAVCVLLRLQLHILARSIYNSSLSADRSNQYSSSQEYGDSEGGDVQLDNEMFRALVESTYRTMFGSGLKAFSSLVRHRVATDLKHWTVQDKLAVDFGDLADTISAVRRNIESDLASVVQTIFIGQDDPSSLHTPTSSSTSTSSEEDSPYEHHVTGNTPEVQKLLNQTYDLLESPMFLSAYSEALDAAFRVIFESLRRNVFTPDNPASHDSLRTLPLASLLPQIKAIAGRLLPASLDTVVSSEVREISSGPCLDSFCVAVFDAP